MYRKVYLIFLFLFAASLILGAQEEEDPFTPQEPLGARSLGVQSFSISLGLFIPLTFSVLYDNPALDVSAGSYTNKLSVGGVGSLSYNVYLSPHLKLGLRVTGKFAYDINNNPLYQVPLTFRGTWEFHPWYRFSIPVFLGVGVNLVDWKEKLVAAPIIRPGVGFYFNWNAEWSFGVDVSYWFVPQSDPQDRNTATIGHFMDIMLAAEYHF